MCSNATEIATKSWIVRGTSAGARRVALALALPAAASLGGCYERGNSSTAGDGTADADADTDADSDDDGPDDNGLESVELSTRLLGLWIGPVTMTPLGSFSTMNMDLRPANDGRTLFGRVDLDADNALRFSFEIEGESAAPHFIFRNGGLFSGLTRDSRTVAVETDLEAERFRFCSLTQGCSYIDAVFDFDGASAMVLDVTVQGEPHVHWVATRAETRTASDPFPADQEPVGDGSQPFPAMPNLDVTVQWTNALAADADVWVILSTTPCGTTGDCTPCRTFSAVAAAGATNVSFQIPQIHAGEYRGTAILDRDRNFMQTQFPGSADGVSIPDSVTTVATSGTSSKTFTIFSNP